MDEKHSQQPRSRFKDIVRSEVFAAAYWVGAFALLVVFTYFHWFKYKLNFQLSKDPAVWGQFGDFVGGVLNPVCAYMAFLWLVRSYALQKTELAETRDALEGTRIAQQRQVEISLAAARIETANIRLSILSRRLSDMRTELAHAKLEYKAGILSGDYRGDTIPYQQIINLLQADITISEAHLLEILASIGEIEMSLIDKLK